MVAPHLSPQRKILVNNEGFSDHFFDPSLVYFKETLVANWSLQGFKVYVHARSQRPPLESTLDARFKTLLNDLAFNNNSPVEVKEKVSELVNISFVFAV